MRRWPRLLRKGAGWALIALAAAAPFAYGAKGQTAWAALGVLSLVASAVAFMGLAPRARSFPSPGLVALLVGIVALVLVQLVPLPTGLVRFLSPTRVELARRSAEALGQDMPGWLTVTVSTKTTRDALLLLACYTLAFVAAAGVLGRSRPLRRLFAALSISGAILSLWGLVGMAFPGSGASPLWSGIGANRLANFLAMAFFAAIGWRILAEQAGRPRERMAATAAAGAVALGLALTHSRLGLASAAAALMVLVLLALRRPVSSAPVAAMSACLPVGMADRQAGSERRQRRTAVVAAALVGSMLMLSVLASFSPLWERYSLLFEKDLDGLGRPACWRQALGIVRDFPVTGSGAGSFRHVFPLYQEPGKLKGFWKYAHSDPLNTLTDLGPLGLVLVIAALAWWYRSAAAPTSGAPIPAEHGRRGQSRRSALSFRNTAVWIGIGAVTVSALHSCADFVLKAPANAFALALLAGASVGPFAGAAGRRRPRGMRNLYLAVSAAGVLLALAFVPLAAAGVRKWQAAASEGPARRAVLLKQALAWDPADGETRFDAAEALVKSATGADAAPRPAELEEALAMLRQARNGGTLDARAMYLAGVLRWRLSDVAGGDAAVGAAVDFGRAYPVVTKAAGSYFLRRWMETRGAARDALDRAVESFRRACLIDGRYLSEVYTLLDATPGGAERLAEVTPPHFAAQVKLARHLREAGRGRQALDVLEAACKRAGGEVTHDALKTLAELRDLAGMHEQAHEARVAYLMALPRAARAGAAAGLVARAFKQGRPADAALFVRALRRRHPEEPAGFRARGEFARLSGDWPAAYRELSEYVDRSTDAEGLYYLAVAARATGHINEAELAASRAIDQAGRVPSYYVLRSRIRRQRGAAREAAMDLRVACGMSPRDAGIRIELGRLLLDQERYGEAMELWKGVLEKDPADAAAHVELARVLTTVGEFDDAVAHLRRALSLRPGQPEALRMLEKLGVPEQPPEVETDACLPAGRPLRRVGHGIQRGTLAAPARLERQPGHKLG